MSETLIAVVQPSQSNKAANPDIKKCIKELASARKELHSTNYFLSFTVVNKRLSFRITIERGRCLKKLDKQLTYSMHLADAVIDDNFL